MKAAAEDVQQLFVTESNQPEKKKNNNFYAHV